MKSDKIESSDSGVKIGKRLFSHKVNIVSGIIASTITDVVFIPMELLKIKMQQSRERITGFRMAANIYKQEGWFGFYRGSLFSFVFLGVVSTTRLYLYKYLQHLSQKHEFMDNYPTRILVSSLVVGLFTSITMNPLELIRIKAVSPEYSQTMASSMKAARHIIKSHGLMALQKAYIYACAREVFFHVAFYHTYESTKDFFAKRQRPGLGLVMASLVASPVAWMIVYPIDSIKTNLQGDSFSNPKWTGSSFLRHLKEQNNLLSLYRGLPSIVFRSAIVNLIFLVSWEKSLDWLQRLEDRYTS